MTNSKNTKRALLTSAFSLLICFAMLIGTTFAWFTDTAKTGINSIQTGKLDVVLEVATQFNDAGEPTAWAEVTEDTELFKNVNGDDIIWEPGAAAEEYFRIRNNGNLALKYQFMTNYTNATKTEADKSLADVLQVQNIAIAIENGELADREMYADMTASSDVNTGFAPMKDVKYEEYLLPGEARTVYTLIKWNPTANDNEFNVVGGLSIDLGIKVVATQYTYEFDSNDNQYDEDAGYAAVWSGESAPVERDDNVPATVKTLADVTDTEAKTVKIDSAELLAAFAQSVNGGNSYYGYTVTLETDIDLGNKNWTPIGKPVYDSVGKNVVSGAFSGNFDGQGHTIYNLKVNGGVDSPVDVNAIDQGLFGCLYAHGNMAYVQNLNIHNADVYAKNSAGAFVGNLHTYQHINQSGQSNIWNCKLTGKVTIKGGKSGGICGSPVNCWAVLTSLQNITVEVADGSYVSNVGVVGAGGNVASVAAIAAYSSGFKNITSNLDVIANPGEIGGVVAVANGIFENITFSGNVTVKNVDPENTSVAKYGTVLGTWAPIWSKNYIKESTFTSTGSFTVEYTDGHSVTIDQMVGSRAW